MSNEALNCAVAVLSCDKYADCWMPFFKLKEKYWRSCPFDTYLITEGQLQDRPAGCHFIGINESIWSKRVREGLSQISTKYVIILMDDFFLRKKVDTKRIQRLIERFPENAACFSFDINNDRNALHSEVKGFVKRPRNAEYRLSCQAALWNRQKLIELLAEDCNPWHWESSVPSSDYDFYINCTNHWTFDYGKKNILFGIFRGKWYRRDVVPLFKREHIEVDYSKRGFFPEEPYLQERIKIVKLTVKRALKNFYLRIKLHV